MQPHEKQNPPAPRRIWRWIAVGTCLGILLLAVFVFNFLTLNGDATALRRELFSAMEMRATSEIELSAGPVMLTMARAAVGCIDEVPPEARQALRAVRSASVGVYSRTDDGVGDPRALLAAADRAMSRRSWSRIVAVSDDRQAVLVYMPDRSPMFGSERVCLAVCRGDRLVIVAATVKPDALLELVRERPQLAGWL